MGAYLFDLSLKVESCTCANCGILFAFPEHTMDSLRSSHKTFYCPHGHPNVFRGATEAERLREELKRKEQELANTVERKLMAENDLATAKRSNVRMKAKLTRVKNGVCPCCNRSFENLHRHMESKHPEFKPSETVD